MDERVRRAVERGERIRGSHAQDSEAFLELIAACRSDRRVSKIDLLVGVYRDEQGNTPIMAAVKAAEGRLCAVEASKSYLPVAGREPFTTAMIDLVLGRPLADRACGFQTIGAAGALRLLLELAKRVRMPTAVWVGDPAYPGHTAIAAGAGLPVKRYRYAASAEGALDEDQVLDALAAASSGDIVILDASCHNPTGIDLSEKGWAGIGRLCQAKGLIPLIDVAYQGLGRSIAQDCVGISILSRFAETVLVAVSCSKTFGVYRDRAGVAIIVGPAREQLQEQIRILAEIGFAMYGVPPDHGAAIVEIVLSDPRLREMWQAELAGMRERIGSVREHLWECIGQRLDARRSAAFAHIRTGKGLFALLPLGAREMHRLRVNYGVYGLDNGRINLACLLPEQLGMLSEAIARILSD